MAASVTFEKNTFGKRLRTMFHVDFRRMFTMPLLYITVTGRMLLLSS